MLDINYIKENTQKVKDAIASKNRSVDVDQLLDIDAKRRGLIVKLDDLRHKQKAYSKDNATEARVNKEVAKKIEAQEREISVQYFTLLSQIPNPPLDFVPIGEEKDNKVIKTVGEPTKFDFEAKDHIDIGKNLGIIDFEKSGAMSGARFYTLVGNGALLELSLMRYVIDILVAKGFTFILPPHLLNSFSMRGMGYLDHGGDQEIYHLPKDNLYLIGTSEQALGAYYQNSLFDEKDLPLRLCAYSPCYRREAGSYGRDTKGMLRVHQFSKVEMFSYVLPVNSRKEHHNLVDIEEEIVSLLEIPYQLILIASGDLGDPAAAKFDIEAWLPGQNKYREITSCSNVTDYQARRLNIRYKTKQGSSEYVHMLNGTGVSSRALIAILENNQQADGSVLIPEVLRKYTGFDKITS